MPNRALVQYASVCMHVASVAPPKTALNEHTSSEYAHKLPVLAVLGIEYWVDTAPCLYKEVSARTHTQTAGAGVSTMAIRKLDLVIGGRAVYHCDAHSVTYGGRGDWYCRECFADQQAREKLGRGFYTAMIADALIEVIRATDDVDNEHLRAVRRMLTTALNAVCACGAVRRDVHMPYCDADTAGR